MLDQFTYTPLRAISKGTSRLTQVDITEPEEPTEIVSLADAKAWLRVDYDDDDTIIQAVIDECVSQAQEITQSSFYTRTIKTIYDDTSAKFRLPYGPVQEITSVVNADGDALGYTYEYEMMEVNGSPAIITYEAGYENLPAGILLALRKMILSNYDDREDNVMGGVTEISNNSRKMLMRYRRY